MDALDALKTFIPQLGFGALLLYLLFSTIKEKNETIEKLTQRNQDLGDKFTAMTSSVATTVTQVQMTMTTFQGILETQRQMLDGLRASIDRLSNSVEAWRRP